MTIFEIKNGKQLLTRLKGRRILQVPRLNKGSAFSKKERLEFDLLGLLPNRQETLEEQCQRIYNCFCKLDSNLDKHVFLRQIRNQNETLFYYCIQNHFDEMLPIIYTPTIGEAVENFSKINLQTRGLFISYPDRKVIKNLIAPYRNYPIKIVIITDGEGVLGIGDQGAGGINIAVAKGSLYALLGELDPSEILPVQIDVGTNNKDLIADPNYLGWKHARITGKEYIKFVDNIIKSLQKHFPNCFIHWEDFARDNAQMLLKAYQKEYCTFNDDIQGTGAVALATILNALAKKEQALTTQNVIIYGAGSAGIGIAEQICLGMQQLGLSAEAARARILLIDRYGILCHDSELTPEQAVFAKKRMPWMQQDNALLAAIEHSKATILIGCSAQSGHFNAKAIEKLLLNDERPIIMPLSNPTYKAEAKPADLLKWSDGKAFIATGSPFAPVEYKGNKYVISQCNNMFIFPGIGRALTITKARHLTQGMIMAACEGLAAYTHQQSHFSQLLPNTNKCKAANKAVTIAVIKQVMSEGLNQTQLSDIKSALKNSAWTPKYLNYILKVDDYD